MKKTNRLIYLSLFLALFLALGGSQVWAATITASTTGNWSSTAVWTGGVLPTASDNISIATGVTVSVDADYTVTNVTTVGTGILQPKTTGTYTLTIKGTITTSAAANVVNINGSNSNGILNIVLTNTSSKAITENAANNIEFYNLTLSTGSVATISKSFKVEGDLTLNDNCQFTQSSGTCSIFGVNSIITVPTLGTLTLWDVVLEATASNVTTSSDFTVDNGFFHLANGAKFTASSGTITFSPSSVANIMITPYVASGTAGDLKFSSVVFSLTSSTFAPSTGFTITANLDKSGTGLFEATAGAVVFENNASKDSPKYFNANSRTSFFNLTVKDGSHISTASSATIGGGSTGGNLLTIEGSGSFKQTSGTMEFFETAGSANVGVSVSSNGSLQLNNIVIEGDASTETTSFLATSDIIITGSLTTETYSSCSFTSPSTVYFTDDGNNTGTKTLTNGGAGWWGMTFNNLELTDSQDQTTVASAASQTITLLGNLTIKGNSYFNASNSNTISFRGTTAKTLTNEGTCTFHALFLSDESGNVLNTSSNFTIDDWLWLGSTVSSGAIVASGNSTIDFSLAGDPFYTGNQAAHSFQNVTFSAAATDVLAANNIIIKGDLIKGSSGSVNFTSYQSNVKFAGTSAQKIQGDVTLDDVELDNANGLTLEGNLTIGASTNSATLTLTNGDIDLNGDNIITFGHESGALIESSGKTIKNTKTGSGYITSASSISYSLINSSGLGVNSLSNGTFTVRRYHNPLTVGSGTSIERYWRLIHPAGEGTTDASVSFTWDDSELNSQTETNLTMYVSSGSKTVTNVTSSASNTTTMWYPVNYVASSLSTTNNSMQVDLSSNNYNGFYAIAPRSASFSNFPTEAIDNDNKLSTSPLVANTQNAFLLGFTLSTTGTLNGSDEFDALTVTMSKNPTGIFSNFELYRTTNISTTNASSIKAGTVSGSTVQFSSLNQTPTAMTQYYYILVADVDGTVGSSTPSIYAKVEASDFTISYCDISANTVTGTVFTFGDLSVAVSSANSPSSGALEKNATVQEIYGFKLTPPTNAPDVTFSQVNIKVDVGNSGEYNDFTNFKLYRDDNKNGSYDSGDSQEGSTIAAIDESTGILTFTISQGVIQSSDINTEWILICDVASDAIENGTLKCKIQSYSDLTVTSPATIPSGGPYEGNVMTVRAAPVPGSPTTLTIVNLADATAVQYIDGDKGENEFIISSNATIKIQAQDANGYPQKVDQATTILLTPLDGTTINAHTAITIPINKSTSNIITDLQFTTASTVNDFKLTAAVSAGTSLTSYTVENIRVYAANPTSFTTAMASSSVVATTASLAFTAGGGSNRIVVCKAGGWPTAPEDGTDYTASADFSSPSSSNGTTGTGSVVVYEGSGTSVNLTGLTAKTTYYVVSYEFNGSGYGTNYLTQGQDNGGTYNELEDRTQFTTTYAEPTSKSSTMAFSSVTDESMVMTWTKPSSGGGTYSIVVARYNAAPSTTPTDTNTYTANAAFGTAGTGLGNGFVVYNGTGNTVTVSGLVADKRYYFRVYEFNGTSGQENYLTSQYLSGDRYTIDNEPTAQASEISFSDMTLGTNNQVRLSWIRGNGDKVLVVGKAGSPITSNETPSDQSVIYTSGNVAYGTGTAIGQGYVLSQGTESNITVTGLQYGETYYFKAFEYNVGSSGNNNTTTDNSQLNYITSDATNNPNSRIADSYEPNDVLADAKFVSSDGTLVTGIITSENDADWLSFRPDFDNSKENVRIKLTGLPANYTIELYRSDGRLIRKSILSGTNDETLVINNLPEADYYVKIYSADGEYSLTPYRVNILNRTDSYNADTQ